MTIKPGYIYACIWQNKKSITFYNLVTSVTSSKILGRCVQASDPARCDPNQVIHWDKTDWHNSRHSIIELGKLEDLPELFL